MQLHKMSLILVLLLEKLFKVIIQAFNGTESLFSASFLINFRKFGFLVTLEKLTSKYIVQTTSNRNLAIPCVDNVQTTFFWLSEKIQEKNEFSLKTFVLEQSNFMFTASILTCATAFFARFHFFEKGCNKVLIFIYMIRENVHNIFQDHFIFSNILDMIEICIIYNIHILFYHLIYVTYL